VGRQMMPRFNQGGRFRALRLRSKTAPRALVYSIGAGSGYAGDQSARAGLLRAQYDARRRMWVSTGFPIRSTNMAASRLVIMKVAGLGHAGLAAFHFAGCAIQVDRLFEVLAAHRGIQGR